MKYGNKVLSSFQSNFIKDLMGDPLMTDVLAEAILAKLAKKHDVDFAKVLDVASEKYDARRAEFLRLEAEELAKSK